MHAKNLFDGLFTPERAARVAVLYQRREITYDELRHETVLAGEALHASGIGAGDRVGILLNDSPEFITSFVAIISLGAIAVPINLALRREDQLFILKDCSACAAIVESQTAESLFTDSGSQTDIENLLTVSRGDGLVESDTASIAGIN